MSQYETQEYKLISSIDGLEIRYYPSSIIVKCTDDENMNLGFNYLFRYISGANDLKKKQHDNSSLYGKR
jgi:hypothetical protein